MLQFIMEINQGMVKSMTTTQTQQKYQNGQGSIDEGEGRIYTVQEEEKQSEQLPASSYPASSATRPGAVPVATMNDPAIEKKCIVLSRGTAGDDDDGSFSLATPSLPHKATSSNIPQQKKV